MDSAELAARLEPLKHRLGELGVARLLLVGSGARNELRPDSDLDFVVEFEGPATFLGYMELIELLESTLGRQVDLSTLKSLRPEIAQDLLAEARQVA